MIICLQRCFGAIDGTLIDVVVPTDACEAFRNRHGRVSQNVLCVCDFNMKFTFFYTGWEGAAHDAPIFLHALTQRESQFPWPTDGKPLILFHYL